MSLADDALRAGYRLNRFDVLGSTNDEAMRRAIAGDRGQLWIVADRQSAGRGRHGRTWVSPAGNLYASLLLIDAVDQPIAWQVGFVASVALADAVAAVIGSAAPVAIKWPNDLLVGDAKVAGVLVEGSRLPNGRFALVLGIGVNCASHPPQTPYPATHLAAEGATSPDPTAVLHALSSRVPHWLAVWQRGRGFAAIRAAWLDRALATGTRMSLSAKGQRRTGIFETIDEAGRLVLTTPDGRETIDVGEIHIGEAPAPAG